LETGDLALAALPDGAVVERKTVPDLLGCIGKSRERFERELKRSRHVGRLMIVVEGTLANVLAQSCGIHPSAIIGTLAAWQRRYTPICFAGNVETAAKIAESRAKLGFVMTANCAPIGNLKSKTASYP
jgi:DNA excision repair protein ERCC-4